MDETPVPRSLSRRERLNNLIAHKRKQLRSAREFVDQTTQDLEDFQSDEVRELSESAAEGLDTLTLIQRAFTKLNGVCTGLMTAKNPQEVIRRSIEILIQKDEDWEREESGNDMRAGFFTVYFSMHGNGVKLFRQYRDILFEHRNDDTFLDSVVQALPEMLEYNSKLLSSVGRDLAPQQAAVERASRFRIEVPAHYRGFKREKNQRVETIKRNIKRLYKAATEAE